MGQPAVATKVPSPCGPDGAECLGRDLGWLLAQAKHALASEVARAFVPLALSPRGYHVLESALTGAFTQTEIAKAVGLDKTTMVVTVDELEAAGLAKRIPSPHDRRARVIEVTEAGRAKVREGREVVQEIQADVLAALEPKKAEALTSALRDLIAGRLADPVACTPPMRRREPRVTVP